MAFMRSADCLLFAILTEFAQLNRRSNVPHTVSATFATTFRCHSPLWCPSAAPTSFTAQASLHSPVVARRPGVTCRSLCPHSLPCFRSPLRRDLSPCRRSPSRRNLPLCNRSLPCPNSTAPASLTALSSPAAPASHSPLRFAFPPAFARFSPRKISDSY